MFIRCDACFVLVHSFRPFSPPRKPFLQCDRPCVRNSLFTVGGQELDMFPIVERQIVLPVNMKLNYSTSVTIQGDAPEAETSSFISDVVKLNSPVPNVYSDPDTASDTSMGVARSRASQVGKCLSSWRFLGGEGIVYPPSLLSPLFHITPLEWAAREVKNAKARKKRVLRAVVMCACFFSLSRS